MAEAANAQDLFSGTKPVVDSHKFNEANLAAWMQAHVEGYEGPLEVRQFKGGQSNPTYQLVTPKKKYVMRRKPPGKLLPSAHAVDSHDFAAQLAGVHSTRHDLGGGLENRACAIVEGSHLQQLDHDCAQLRHSRHELPERGVEGNKVAG